MTVTGGTTDVSAEFSRTAAVGKVPEATWTVLPSTPQPAANVIASVVGLSMIARVDIATETVTVQIERAEISADVKPLPFGLEAAQATRRKALGKLRDAAMATTKTLTALTDTFATLRELTGGANGDVRLGRSALRADRAAPPRLAALPTGIADTGRRPTVATPVVPVVDPPVELDTNPGAPRLAAWLRAVLPVAANTTGPTFTTGTRAPRVSAPTLAGVTAEVASPLGAWLRLTSQGSTERADTKSVMPRGRVPLTRAAGLRRERIRALRSDPDFSGIADELDAAMFSNAVPVRGGDALVWTLANSRQDRAEHRPVVEVTGLPARVVSLGRTGEVLADQVTGDGSAPVAVPEGAERVAVLGGAEPPGRYAGWLADGGLVQVSERAYLGGGCALVTSSASTRRRHGTVTTSLVRARDAVLRAASVLTHLPAGSRTVMVVLDGSGEELPELSIGGAATSPDPPQLVQLGERTAMLLAVAPIGTEPVTVTVADRRSLAGVLGSFLPVDTVVSQLAAAGAGAFGSLAPSPLAGTGTLRWRSA